MITKDDIKEPVLQLLKENLRLKVLAINEEIYFCIYLKDDKDPLDIVYLNLDKIKILIG